MRARTWLSALILAAGAAVVPAVPGVAVEGLHRLELRTEIAYGTPNLPVIVTAQLDKPAEAIMHVYFLFQRGRHNPDTMDEDWLRPHLSCNIDPGQNHCEVIISGDYEPLFVTGWIDYDRQRATVDADTTEGRYAGPSDCDSGVPCDRGEVAVPGSAPHFGSAEPDNTDVGVVFDRLPRAIDDSANTRGLRPVTLNVLNNDTGEGIEVASVAAPTAGTVHWSANGELTYTPKPGAPISDSFAYTIRGAFGTTSSAKVTITR